MGAQQENAIELRNVSYRYSGSDKDAIRDVNLSVEWGSFVVIVGPSGSGKSTLCLTLNGLIPKAIHGKLSGDIEVAGHRVKEKSIAEMSREVGVIFQDPEAQLFDVTVEDEVALALENRGLSSREISERIERALDEIGLQELRYRFPLELSTGQKQKVALAVILAMGARVVVFDDPTANLDPKGRSEFFAVVKRLSLTKRNTILMVERRIGEVAPYADRIVVMNDGQIVYNDSPRRIFSEAEDLRKIGLPPPPFVELALKLRARGANIPDIPLDIDEAEHVFSKILSVNQNMGGVSQKFLEKTGGTENTIDSMEPIILVKDVSFTYPNGAQALRNLNLKISTGEFVALIGQNGSGKTTLVKSFIKLLKPTIGTILVNGLDTRKTTTADLAKTVGFLFQNPNYQLFEKTVFDEIAFGPRNLGFTDIEGRVKEALALEHLGGLEDRDPLSLSFGERHRLALASVLSMRPKILVVDEPTTGMHYGYLESLMKRLQSLNESGVTIVMISHDMDIVAQYARRVVVMCQGEIIADGPVREILLRPEILEKTFLEQTPITKLSNRLARYGIPQNVILTDEICEAIARVGVKQLCPSH